MKFLVVDDSTTMRRIVGNSLKNLGWNDIVEAENGQDAIGKLQSNPDINFVITDWNMPVLSGLDLTKTIRSSERFKNIPILMVTTRGVKDDILEALQAKVNNYVIKPFTPQILKEKIDQVLEAVTA
ncbi:MAG: response regulator [Ignavibacteria bacterium]|nr:MAG: response regulator [Ignavibacteria bacterium]